MANMLERAVPRYTSYPTAPNFSAAVDADVFGLWLASLPSAAALSLYLHVPFCRELCHYCGCHTKATLRDEPIIAYAQRLAEEIALVASHTGRRKVTHIHWGGGTPSILDAASSNSSPISSRAISISRRSASTRSNWIRAISRRSWRRRCAISASIAPASACRTSASMCSRRPAASSHSTPSKRPSTRSTILASIGSTSI